MDFSRERSSIIYWIISHIQFSQKKSSNKKSFFLREKNIFKGLNFFMKQNDWENINVNKYINLKGFLQYLSRMKQFHSHWNISSREEINNYLLQKRVYQSQNKIFLIENYFHYKKDFTLSKSLFEFWSKYCFKYWLPKIILTGIIFNTSLSVASILNILFIT